MKKNALALASGLISFTASSAFGAGVLTDSGFENNDPLVDDGNGVGKWNPFTNGPTFEKSTSAPRTGNSHLQLSLTGAANQFAGVFQDIEVSPGDDISIELWHSATNNDPVSPIEIRIEWLMAGAVTSNTGNSTPTPGTGYEMFSITHTAPAGADGARVVYAIQSFSGNLDAVVNVDDFTVSGSSIPEPSGTVLLSLGALGLLTLRRRK